MDADSTPTPTDLARQLVTHEDPDVRVLAYTVLGRANLVAPDVSAEVRRARQEAAEYRRLLTQAHTLLMAQTGWTRAEIAMGTGLAPHYVPSDASEISA